jgi:hypothetical protein
MKCSTCKYWDINKDSKMIPNTNYCKKPIMFWDATVWTTKEIDDPLVGKYKTDVDRNIKEEYKDLKMFVQDGSDYWAGLITREDFFCAHWEQK